MAYNNYPLTYQPYYQQPYSTNQNSGSPVWVQGESGAKSYLVAPNNSVMLMDSEGAYFYMKSADSSGMPTLKKYSFQEVAMGTTQQPKSELSQYVRKDELEEFITNFLKKRSAEE